MSDTEKTIAMHALASEINEHHRQARIHAQSVIEHALLAGEALTRAKAAVGHGSWRKWLAENTEISERTAQRYMRISQNRAALEGKTATLADLAVSEAERLLAGGATSGNELSEREQRDFAKFMERVARRDSELARVHDACEAASDAKDIDGLRQVVSDCTRLEAESISIRRLAERRFVALGGMEAIAAALIKP
jgi:hypothetical protein